MEVKLNFLNHETITRETPSEILLKLLLKNRGVNKVDAFINTPLPELKLNSKKVTSLIKKHLDSQKNILIYGDYDVDGLSSTALLWQALYPLNKNTIPFIPHREVDGYGFKASSFFRIQTEKKIDFDLLITVDNGIVADKEFAKIKAKYPNIHIVVIDHHLADGQLKFVDALFHSTLTSASVLAYFIAKEFASSSLSLAALGVVADCQPLLDLNRSVLVHGLTELKLNPSPGLKKLIEISGAKRDSLSVYDLGFLIAPRLNAVGRLSDPTDALRLLCSSTPAQAAKYAQSLNSFNQERQSLQKESLEIADKNINHSDKMIFIADAFNPGIIGLIAGRLTEKYALPSIIISQNGDVAKGSCRSIPKINIIEVLRKYSSLFVDLGGHPGAAGFSINNKNILKLYRQLKKYFSIHLKNYLPQKIISVDCKMTTTAVNLKNINLINTLAPFGIGNPEPLFYFDQLVIDSKTLLGKNKEHLKFRFDGVDAIAFKKGDLDKDLKIGDTINVVASLDLNTWNGRTFPQLIVREIIPQ